MRSGVRIGVDVGKARIGVAKCDPSALLATPVETVRRDHEGERDVDRVCDIVSEHNAIEIVVGLPLNMRGEHTASTEDALSFARALAKRGVDVRLVDERLSTVSAMSHLHASGRTTKNSRGVIDQAAAVVILQHALDSERAQGSPVGTLVHVAASQPGEG